MANVFAHFAGVNWGQQAAAVWGWARQEGGHGFAYLQGLPRQCLLASAHAAMVCIGEPPSYGVPGFGPIVSNWGWLLMGLMLGATLALLLMYCTGYVRRELGGPALARLAPAPALGNGVNEAQAEVLQFLMAGGRPALQELARATGMTEAQFLERVLGVAPQPQQQAPQQHQQLGPQHLPNRLQALNVRI